MMDNKGSELELAIRQQPLGRFWKDEGGRANVLRFTVAVPDDIKLPRPLPLQAVLLYEGGAVVEDQEDALNLVTPPSAMALTAAAPELTIEFRIEKVSRKRGDRNFCLLVEPVYSSPSSAPSTSAYSSILAQSPTSASSAAPSHPTPTAASVRLRGVTSVPINVMSKRVKGDRLAVGASSAAAGASAGASSAALAGAGAALTSVTGAADGMGAAELLASLASMHAALVAVKATAEGSNAVLRQLLAAPLASGERLTGSSGSSAPFMSFLPLLGTAGPADSSRLPHYDAAGHSDGAPPAGQLSVHALLSQPYWPAPQSSFTAHMLHAGASVSDVVARAGAGEFAPRASSTSSRWTTLSSCELSVDSRTASSTGSSSSSSSSSSSASATASTASADATSLPTAIAGLHPLLPLLAGARQPQVLPITDAGLHQSLRHQFSQAALCDGAPQHLPDGLAPFGRSLFSGVGSSYAVAGSGGAASSLRMPHARATRLRGGGSVALLPAVGAGAPLPLPVPDHGDADQDDDADFFGMLPMTGAGSGAAAAAADPSIGASKLTCEAAGSVLAVADSARPGSAGMHGDAQPAAAPAAKRPRISAGSGVLMGSADDLLDP